jgi:hypothetical protein
MMTMVLIVKKSTDNMHQSNNEIHKGDNQRKPILPAMPTVSISSIPINPIQEHDTAGTPDIEEPPPVPLVHKAIVLFDAGPFKITGKSNECI